MLPILLTAALLGAPAAAPVPANNAKCPVCGGRVDRNAPKATVRGREYGLCRGMNCKVELEKTPDKYLRPDGTPKNQ